jgi:hypothetical protein
MYGKSQASILPSLSHRLGYAIKSSPRPLCLSGHRGQDEEGIGLGDTLYPSPLQLSMTHNYCGVGLQGFSPLPPSPSPGGGGAIARELNPGAVPCRGAGGSRQGHTPQEVQLMRDIHQ